MGARTIRTKDASIRGKQETLTLWTIIAGLVFPMLLAVALVGMDMRIDLSELKSTGLADDQGAVPVGWPDLETPEARHEGPGPVRMIGYMMDGYQPVHDGALVDMFILLPEAGQFLHPAHRIPNQMVEVRPSHPVVFRYRDLVWATGILDRTFGASRNTAGAPGNATAAYAIRAAEVTPAAQRDIGKWFQP